MSATCKLAPGQLFAEHCAKWLLAVCCTFALIIMDSVAVCSIRWMKLKRKMRLSLSLSLLV